MKMKKSNPPINQVLLGNSVSEYDADILSDELYYLSEVLAHKNESTQAHGFLGGEYGYGNEFENEVFEMHPYYWGECECGYEEIAYKWSESHPHKDCYQNEYKKIPYDWIKQPKEHTQAVRALCKKFGINYNDGFGSAVHCTCGHDKEWKDWSSKNDHLKTCLVVVPNFKHKKTGLEIRWYKYIGRGMSCNQNVSEKQFKEIVKDCIDSLT